MRRIAGTCCLVLSSCASAPAVTHSAADRSEAFATSSDRFDQIVSRYQRVAVAYAPRANLSTPTNSMECEVERLRAVLTALGVAQAYAQTLSAAMLASQAIEEERSGMPRAYSGKALDIYDHSVNAFQRSIVRARKQERSFINCLPPTLYLSSQ